LYWTNFNLPNILSERISPDWSRIKNEAEAWNKFHDYDFRKYKGKAYREIGRNLVDYEAGLTIFNTARNIITKSESNQITMF
jgi:hypothetical protein